MSLEFPFDPREALDASLTALALGELAPDQEAFVRQAMVQDPELARRYERLKQTIEMVKLAEADPAVSPSEPPVALRLSDERRQALLQTFRTVTPPQFTGEQRRKINWTVPVAIAALFVVVLGAALLPALSRSKSRGQIPADLASRALSPEEFERERLSKNAADSYRTLNRLGGKPAEDPPVVKVPEVQTKIVLPDGVAGSGDKVQTPIGSTELLGQTSEQLATLPQWADHSTVGIGGRAQITVKPAEPAPQEGAAMRRKFLQRYGLARQSAEGFAQSTPGNQGPKAPAGETPPAAAIVGVPVQTATQPQQPSSRPDEAGTWSLSASLRGFYPDVTNRNGTEQNLGLTDSLTRFGSAAAVPAQSVAESEQLLRPVLGDEPTLGGLFQRTEIARKDVKLAETSQSAQEAAGRPIPVAQPSQSKGLGLPSQSANEFASNSLWAGYAAPGLAPPAGENGATFYKLERAQGSEPALMPDLAVDVKEQTFGSNLDQKTVAGQSPQAYETKKRDLDELQRGRELLKERAKQIAAVTGDLSRLQPQTNTSTDSDASLPKPAAPAPVPQPEVQTSENAFSTFSLNVSDVSFKLAAASLAKGVMPEPASIRAEEFINAFEYRDPEPAAGAPLAFAWERAHDPFTHNRDFLRFSIKTASQGRPAGRPLNLVLLLDNSGSMERADRVRIIREALRVLAAQLQAQDTLSVVTFARTARLWVDGVPGNQAGQVAEQVGGLTPQGGTNLEEAMNLAYQTALRHYLADGINRVVLLTDGAANLGDVSADSLKKKVEASRKQGIALDCFGIGWDGYNDDLLETLTRNGDGRYGFINTPEEATTGFAEQLAGALKVAAADVKVQVEFNPSRVTTYRQIGYAKHQLTAQQFRDNTVDAAELGAAESGNAVYVIQVNPNGAGDLATVRVRFKVPGTSDYREYAWAVPYTGTAPMLAQSSPAMRLAATAGAFAEWLASSPHAAEVTTDGLQTYLNGVPQVYGPDTRPQVLGSMLREAKALGGK